MAIKTVEKLLTKDHDVSEEITCPCCNQKTCLRLFENIDLSAIASLKGKDKESYFAVCPLCASVFEVNKNYMKERKNSTFCIMTESDLTVVQKGKENDQH